MDKYVNNIKIGASGEETLRYEADIAALVNSLVDIESFQVIIIASFYIL